MQDIIHPFALLAISEAARLVGRSPAFFTARAALAGLPGFPVKIGGGRIVMAVPAEAAGRLIAELGKGPAAAHVPPATPPAAAP